MEIYHQLTLPRFRRSVDPNSFTTIAIGSTAEAVFRRIIEANKHVHSFTVYSYNMMVDSDDEQQIDRMRPMRRKDVRHNGLQQRSREFYKRSVSPEGTPQVFGMAVSSVLTLRNGRLAYIPMLDFASRTKEDVVLRVETIKDVLRPYPGFLLETGNSYHFWGTQILSLERWREFLLSAARSFTHNELDTAYIDYSLQRNFNGLRLFAYGKTKPVTPHVVERIGDSTRLN